MVDNREDFFPHEAFEYLYMQEDEYWWFVARRRLIIFILSHYRNNIRDFMEAGCGSGNVIRSIMDVFPDWNCSASELSDEGLHYASKRLLGCSLEKIDLLSMKINNSLDCIGIFDVLEHIPDDQLVLENIYNALRPGGLLLITVPQHQWLWSSSDVYAKHVRRYTLEDLSVKIKHERFRIEYTTSFVFLLLPLMTLQRFVKCERVYKPDSEFDIPSFMNKFFSFIMRIEFILLKIGFKLPIGGSLLLLARKS